VKLLLFTVYESLGLGEFRPTKIVLRLVNWSIRLPKGLSKDMFIKVGEFIYSVNFVVLALRIILGDSYNKCTITLIRVF